jgi:hypothetical protein
LRKRNCNIFVMNMVIIPQASRIVSPPTHGRDTTTIGCNSRSPRPNYDLGYRMLRRVHRPQAGRRPRQNDAFDRQRRCADGYRPTGRSLCRGSVVHRSVDLHGVSFMRGLWPRPVDCCICGPMTVRVPVMALMSLCLAASGLAHIMPARATPAMMIGLAPDTPRTSAATSSSFPPDP